MNVARINMSHGTRLEHKQSIKNINISLSSRPHAMCAILLDTTGTEIRTGKLRTKHKLTGINLTKNFNIKMWCDYKSYVNRMCTLTDVTINYNNLVKNIRINDKILIGDGLIELKIIRKGRCNNESISFFSLSFLKISFFRQK